MASPSARRDYGRDPRITETLIPEIEQAGIRGMLAVPVRLQNEVVGMLYGFWGQPVDLSDEHVSLATDLARVVAVAVANARLYQEARDREAEARALFEVGRLISSTLDPDRVFDRIVERVLELMRVRACGIFRLDPDGLLRYARGCGPVAGVHAGPGRPARRRDLGPVRGRAPTRLDHRDPDGAGMVAERPDAAAGRARGLPGRPVRADPHPGRSLRLPGDLLVGAPRAHRGARCRPSRPSPPWPRSRSRTHGSTTRRATRSSGSSA